MLSFNDLRQANETRVQRWHGPDSEPWTGADWSNAMCGEAGEAANVVKKLRRGETNTASVNDPSREELIAMLADEIGDVICYLDLLALHYGIDVGEAVASKFNRVSEREGFLERLTANSPDRSTAPEVQDAIRMALASDQAVTQGGMSALEIREWMSEQWPGCWPGWTIIDIADELQAMYG